MKRLFGIFCGLVDDGGFIESGYRGAREACSRFGLQFEWVGQIEIDVAALVAAIDAAASSRPDLIVVHGGRSDEAVASAAARHPDIHFLSTHGESAGANYSCFTIAQPQSAFLAGVLLAETSFRTQVC